MVSVEISKAENGTPKILVDGKDISDRIFDFNLSSGRFGEMPELTITMPVSKIEMSKDFLASVTVLKR